MVAVALDESTTRAVSLGEDGKLKLWEFASGKVIGELLTDSGAGAAFAGAERSLKAGQAVLAARKTQFDAAEKKVAEELEKSKKAAVAAAAAEADFRKKQAAFVAANDAKAKSDREVAEKEAAKHPSLKAAKDAAKKLDEDLKKKSGELDAAKRALVNANSKP